MIWPCLTKILTSPNHRHVFATRGQSKPLLLDLDLRGSGLGIVSQLGWMSCTLNIRSSGFFVLVLLFSSLAWGDLLLWTPQGRDVTYVLPGNVSPEMYLRAMVREPALRSFVQELRFHPKDSVVRISAESGASQVSGGRDRVLIVTNWAQDLSQKPKRLLNFMNLFRDSDMNSGLSSWALPVGAALTLRGKDEKAFYAELTRQFDLFVFMGGDDKEPSLYGHKNTHSVNTNRLRDFLEQKLIRFIYYQSSKKIFGICRGLQQVFTSLSGKLIQDIPKETSIREEHGGRVFHEIQLLKTRNGNVKALMENLSQKEVLSHHHQMADPESIAGTIFELAAVSPQGSVEALESRDNRVVLVQFHPELKANHSHAIKGFFARLQAWFKSPSVKFCSQLF